MVFGQQSGGAKGWWWLKVEADPSLAACCLKGLDSGCTTRIAGNIT